MYLLTNCYGEISNSFLVTVIRENSAYGIFTYQSTVCDFPCNEFSLRERMTVNHDVVGSSPTGGAKNTPKMHVFGVFSSEKSGNL